MPWSDASRRSDRYGRDHRAERARHIAALKRAGAGLCAEPRCLMKTRIITPDMDLHLSHDPTGTRYIGLSHRLCNVTEAARRARARQGRHSGRNAKTKTLTPRRSPLTW